VIFEPTFLIYNNKCRFKMYYTVYKITNLINNKIYIGVHKTSNLSDEYMGSGNLIKNAIKKHGIENFKKEYLKIFDSEEEMYEMESIIVNKDFIKETSVYNIKEGGFGGWSYVNEMELNKSCTFEKDNKYGSWKNKQKRIEILNKIPMNKRIEIGRNMGINYGGSNKLTEDVINTRLELIKDIDLTKYGWVKIVSKKLNLTHTQVRRFVEKYYKGDYYKRNNGT
jgi:hypothetical protein